MVPHVCRRGQDVAGLFGARTFGVRTLHRHMLPQSRAPRKSHRHHMCVCVCCASDCGAAV